MGVITLVLITAGYQESGTGPQIWVVVAAGLAIGLGTYSGGWRIMRTMGKGLVDLQSPQGFAAETDLGGSHSRVVAHGFRALHHAGVLRVDHRYRAPVGRSRPVRWSTARRMVYGWLLTLPAATLFGAVAAWIALSGPVGVMVVLAALIGGSPGIYAISRRSSVNHRNVNDSRDVVDIGAGRDRVTGDGHTERDHHSLVDPCRRGSSTAGDERSVASSDQADHHRAIPDGATDGRRDHARRQP